MHFSGVRVLFILALVSMALGAFVICGRSVRGFVVGTSCGDSGG